MFKISNGSSTLLTIMLMLIIIAITSIGFIVLVSYSNDQAGVVNNDSVNLSGITYKSEIYNGTNATLRSLSNVMPNFIWIVIIFLIISILLIVSIAFKGR